MKLNGPFSVTARCVGDGPTSEFILCMYSSIFPLLGFEDLRILRDNRR